MQHSNLKKVYISAKVCVVFHPPRKQQFSVTPSVESIIKQ